jgi:translation initiation factor 3 subunit E
MWVLPLLQGHVVMGTQAVSPYQQVIEKTKNLAFRSQVLALTIEKKTGSFNKQEVSKNWSSYSLIEF